MKFKTRRLVPNHVRIVGRAPEDYAQELQEWLEKLSRQVEGGIPAGFNVLTPTTIDGTTPASPGTEGEGWAAALHQHPLDISGVPADIGATNVQGAGPGISLSGHTHRFPFTDHTVLGLSSFFPHPSKIPVVQAGSGVTIVENALGPIVSATGGSSDDASMIIASRVYGG